MITKERLNELIEKGATIYTFCYYQTKKDIVGIDTSIYKKKEIRGNLFYCGVHIIGIENIFETEEDAEFDLRYKNITRPETLSLPTWEEVEKLIDKVKNGKDNFINLELITQFYTKDNGLIDFDVYLLKEDNSLMFEITNNDEFNYEFEATKDNYLKGCEICRKLFLGENVEEL